MPIKTAELRKAAAECNKTASLRFCLKKPFGYIQWIEVRQSIEEKGDCFLVSHISQSSSFGTFIGDMTYADAARFLNLCKAEQIIHRFGQFALKGHEDRKYFGFVYQTGDEIRPLFSEKETAMIISNAGLMFTHDKKYDCFQYFDAENNYHVIYPEDVVTSYGVRRLYRAFDSFLTWERLETKSFSPTDIETAESMGLTMDEYARQCDGVWDMLVG